MANHVGNITTIFDNSNLQLVGTNLQYTKLDGTTQILVDLSSFLDDTNLARITSSSIDVAGLVTFTRDDSSTFTLDLSSLTNIADVVTSISKTSFNIAYVDELGATTNLNLTSPAINSLNVNTTTNLNTDTSPSFNVLVPIFGIHDDIQSGQTDFTKISETQFQVNFDGFVRIVANVHVTSTTNRTSVNIRTKVDGSLVGPIGASGYIRTGGSGHQESSMHIDFIHYVTNGQIITLGARREANAGTVVMTTGGSSNMYLEKLSDGL